MNPIRKDQVLPAAEPGPQGRPAFLGPDPEVVSRELAEWREVHPPTVRVVQRRRWYWYLELVSGGSQRDWWYVVGSAARADRVARRKLVRYLRRLEHRQGRWEITAGDLGR